MITDNHWLVFQLVDQEKQGYAKAALRTGLPIAEVKRLLGELRKMQPELFTIERQKYQLSRDVRYRERRRYNMEIVSYDTYGDVDSQVKEQF